MTLMLIITTYGLMVASPKQESRPFLTRTTTPRTRISPRTRIPSRPHDRAPPRRPSILQRPGLKQTSQKEDSNIKEEIIVTDELETEKPVKSSASFAFSDILSNQSSTTPASRREFKFRFTPPTDKSLVEVETSTNPEIETEKDILTDNKSLNPSSNLDFLFNVFETTTSPSITSTTESLKNSSTTEKIRFRLSPRPVINSRPASKQESSITTAISITTQETKRPISQRPSRPRSQATTTSKSSSLVPVEYEYVYDYDYQDTGALGGSLGDLANLSNKATIRNDGSIECTDTGYFPHPESCKKFISCSKTVRGFLRGWVYTCPQELVFDPVGGMCNWTESVDCKA